MLLCFSGIKLISPLTGLLSCVHFFYQDFVPNGTKICNDLPTQVLPKNAVAQRSLSAKGQRFARLAKDVKVAFCFFVL